jgi:choline dehydrogenase
MTRLALCACVALLASGHIAAASPPSNTSTNATQEYDYIIIGSGPGGGTLAYVHAYLASHQDLE